MLFPIKHLLYSYLILLLFFGPFVVQNQHCWASKSKSAEPAPSPPTILPPFNYKFHYTANFSLQNSLSSPQTSAPTPDHQTTCGCITEDGYLLDLSLLALHSVESRASASTKKAQKPRGETLKAGSQRVNPHHTDHSDFKGLLNATFLVGGKTIIFFFNPCEPIHCEVS